MLHEMRNFEKEECFRCKSDYFADIEISKEKEKVSFLFSQ